MSACIGKLWSKLLYPNRNLPTYRLSISAPNNWSPNSGMDEAAKCCNSTTADVDDLSPALCLKLDKDQFIKKTILFAVGLPIGRPDKATANKMHAYSTGYLRLPKFKSTYKDMEEQERKLIFIRNISAICDPMSDCEDHKIDRASWKELKSLGVDIPVSPTEEFNELLAHPDAVVPLRLLDTLDSDGLPSRPCAYRMTLTYANFTLEQALKIILPKDMEAVTGFNVIGHIAHFNLKSEALPYRKLIGDVVLDKVPRIRTVVNKASKIDSDFRTFAVDLMAGEKDYLTVVKENGINFKLDVSQVYWNSRLGTEHSRIVAEVKLIAEPPSQTVVYDVFAGVGPFSVPLARHGCLVFANDLNPASFCFLEENVKGNSSKRHPILSISCSQLDGREFIRNLVLPHYRKHCSSPDSTAASKQNFFVLMNLPGLAIEFLDAFVPDAGWPSANSSAVSFYSPPIQVRCYCFIRQSEIKAGCTTGTGGDNFVSKITRQAKLDYAEVEAKMRTLKALGDLPVLSIVCSSRMPLEANKTFPELRNWNLRFVRNVAPFKDMYCVEFELHLPVIASDIMEDVKRPRLD